MAEIEMRYYKARAVLSFFAALLNVGNMASITLRAGEMGNRFAINAADVGINFSLFFVYSLQYTLWRNAMRDEKAQELKNDSSDMDSNSNGKSFSIFTNNVVQGASVPVSFINFAVSAFALIADLTDLDGFSMGLGAASFGLSMGLLLCTLITTVLNNEINSAYKDRYPSLANSAQS